MSNTPIENEQAPLEKFKLWLFIAAVLVGIVAEALIVFATPLLVLEHTGKASAAGLAFAIEWLPAVLMYPFAGVIADRIGGRSLFITSSLLRALVVVACVIGLLASNDWIVAILLINAGLMSLFAAPNRMAVEKIVVRLANEKTLPVIQSAVQNSELVAWTLGPALASFLIVYVDNVFVIGVAGVLFLLSAIPILLLVGKDQQGDQQNIPKGKEIIAETAQGFRLLKSSPALMQLAVLNCCINLAFAVSLASHAVIITSDFGMEDSAYGLLNTVAGLLGMLNLILVPLLIRKLGIFHLGVIGLTLISVGLVTTSLVASYTEYLVGFVVASVGLALFNIFNRTQRVKALPPEHIGKVLGPFYVMNLITLPLGGLIVALFADQYGNQILILAVTLLLIIVGPFLITRAQRSFEYIFSTNKSEQAFSNE